MKEIKAKLKRLDKRREELVAQLNDYKSELDFQCGCGARHKFKDCKALQTHWYERPHGCSGGDNWWLGELQIVCPDTGNRNRMLSETNTVMEKFRRQYKDKFKSVKDTYGDDGSDTPWWNNYSIQENPEYYDL